MHVQMNQIKIGYRNVNSNMIIPFHSTDTHYRRMLYKVGQCLVKEDVRKLARIAHLSPNATSVILQGDEGHPEKLFTTLERKLTIDSTNVTWLEDNLLEIENENALAHVKEYLSSLIGKTCDLLTYLFFIGIYSEMWVLII